MHQRQPPPPPGGKRAGRVAELAFLTNREHWKGFVRERASPSDYCSDPQRWIRPGADANHAATSRKAGPAGCRDGQSRFSRVEGSGSAIRFQWLVQQQLFRRLPAGLQGVGQKCVLKVCLQ